MSSPEQLPPTTPCRLYGEFCASCPILALVDDIFESGGHPSPAVANQAPCAAGENHSGRDWREDQLAAIRNNIADARADGCAMGDEALERFDRAKADLTALGHVQPAPAVAHATISARR